MQLSTSSRQVVVSLFLSLLAAVIAVAALLLAFLGGYKVVVGLIAVSLLIGGLVGSGNIRLFILWGLLLTAPLELNKSFNIIPHMGGAAAYKLDAVDIFILPLLIFLIRDFSSGYRQNIRIPKVLYWWIALMMLGALTVLVGPMRQLALLEVVRMLKLTILFFALVNEIVRLKQFEHVIAAMFFGVAIQSVVGILQYAFDLNLGAQIFGEVAKDQAEYTSLATYADDTTFTYRVGALIGHPNLLAIYLAILLPIGISVLFSGIQPVYKFLLSATILMGLMVLVFTLSRSGWLSFGFAFVVLMVISFLDPRLRQKYSFARVVSIIGLVLLLSAFSGPIMKRLLHSDEGAVSFRWEFMEVAADMIADKPILGFGLNSFIWHMPPYTEYKTYQGAVERFGDNLPVVHNIYLLVFVEQGIVGLVLYLGFYYNLLKIGWQGLKIYQQPFLAMINLGCFAGLLALAIDGLASFFIRNDNCGRTFIIVAAIMVAVRWWHYDNVQRRQMVNVPVESL